MADDFIFLNDTDGITEDEAKIMDELCEELMVTLENYSGLMQSDCPLVHCLALVSAEMIKRIHDHEPIRREFAAAQAIAINEQLDADIAITMLH